MYNVWPAVLQSDKAEEQVQHEEDLKALRETHLEELETLKEIQAQQEQDRLESTCCVCCTAWLCCLFLYRMVVLLVIPFSADQNMNMHAHVQHMLV